MYNWYNSEKGGDEIGTASWILFDGFTDQDFKEYIKRNRVNGVRNYQKGG